MNVAAEYRLMRQIYENGRLEPRSNIAYGERLILVTVFSAFMGITYGIARLFPDFCNRF